ncbi:MAG: putative signal transducing protein [Chloroflexota bacterium]
MNEKDKLTLMEVFAGELWKATMIKNVLEDNNIQAFLENSLMGVLEPWVVTPGGYQPVKVVVSNIDYDKAMQLIGEFNQSEPVKED